MSEKRYPIGEVAFILNRKPHTMRTWEYKKIVPDHLLPHRDDRGHRYWTEDQITGLQAWMTEIDLTPGKAFRRKGNSAV